MIDADVALDGQRARRQFQRVTERAVRVGEAVEEIAMLVVARAGDDASIAGENIHRDNGVVHEAVAKRRRLDPDTRDGSAERDGLELRHDRGHRAGLERRVGKVDERRHALGLDQMRFDIHVQHAVEMREVDARRTPTRAIAEEVGRVLREPDRGAPRSAGPGERSRQPRRLLGVAGHEAGS
jgi:hypothetical protein